MKTSFEENRTSQSACQELWCLCWPQQFWRSKEREMCFEPHCIGCPMIFHDYIYVTHTIIIWYLLYVYIIWCCESELYPLKVGSSCINNTNIPCPFQDVTHNQVHSSCSFEAGFHNVVLGGNMSDNPDQALQDLRFSCEVKVELRIQTFTSASDSIPLRRQLMAWRSLLAPHSSTMQPISACNITQPNPTPMNVSASVLGTIGCYRHFWLSSKTFAFVFFCSFCRHGWPWIYPRSFSPWYFIWFFPCKLTGLGDRTRSIRFCKFCHGDEWPERLKMLKCIETPGDSQIDSSEIHCWWYVQRLKRSHHGPRSHHNKLLSRSQKLCTFR